MSDDAMPTGLAVVVMGVSGAGKSTIASALAAALGATFVDADDLHTADARTKMSGGVALTDDDRAPWLQRVALRIAEERFHGGSIVVACSALRRSYRDALRAGNDTPLVFVHLDGPAQLVSERMSNRTGHFMPPELLRSQFETLEPLEADEVGILADTRQTPDEIVVGLVATVRGAA